MLTADLIVADLRAKGKESTRKIYARHGMAEERVLGVSVADLKVIAKSIKGQQALACELYATGIMDAMYLAGLVANGAKISGPELTEMLGDAADLQMVSEYTIPWLAIENARAEHVAAAGWATYLGLCATKADEELDMAEIERLLDVIAAGIHEAPNRVRGAMNSFVIAVGTYVKPLLGKAKTVAQQIGEVYVDVGDTACKIPLATEYIEKVESMGRVGKKRKTMRC